MKKHLFLFCLAIFSLQATRVVSAEESPTKNGTLIVTYKTDNKGERLKRIRFWIKDEEGLRLSLYPKGKTFVDSTEDLSRMIVIDDLAPGKYFVEFLVPNTDSYFQNIPPREIEIIESEVVKIDQIIKPALSERGNDSKSPQPRTAAASEIKRSLPDAKEAASLLHPQPAMEVAVTKPDNYSILGQKNPAAEGFGKLIISYELKGSEESNENRIKFRLVNSSGGTTVHPQTGKDTEVPLNNGKMVMVQLIPTGTYKVEFFYEDAEEDIIHTIYDVKIDANKAKSIHESVSPVHSEYPKMSTREKSTQKSLLNNIRLIVTANIPTAIFKLENSENHQSWEGNGRTHTFSKLTPGTYILRFESFDPLFVPPNSQTLTLREDSNIESMYKTLGKLKIHSNVKDAIVEVVKLDNLEPLSKIEIKDGIGIAYLQEGEYRLKFLSNQTNRHAPRSLQLKIESLQTKEINAYFEEEKA
jgi:hypothetical protein